MTNPSTIRADSVSEQYAWLGWRFGDHRDWSVEAVTYGERDGAELETMSVLADGEREDVSFDVTALRDSDAESEDPTLALDRVMRAATEFAEQNPPQHPGSIARFPVPWNAYQGSLAVPMTVLAVDHGARGLYAPPRIVGVTFSTLEPFGVGEYPGFAPENWPPERLGDWPPPELASMSMSALQGMIGRFSACWLRLLDAWFQHRSYPHRGVDARDAIELLARLDLSAMLPWYRRLSPGFWDWLEDAQQ
jgi:hypothetical protein